LPRHDATPVDPTLVRFATIRRWQIISGMGRSMVYHALANGQLRAKRLGKLTMIDVQHGLVWLNNQPDVKITLPKSRREPQRPIETVPGRKR
jgi:hypothetical protein